MKIIKDIFCDEYGFISWTAVIGGIIIAIILFLMIDRITGTAVNENVVVIDKYYERYNRNSSENYYLKLNYLDYEKEENVTIEVSHGIYETVLIGDTTDIVIRYGGITNIAY